jgi:hypothetical protein
MVDETYPYHTARYSENGTVQELPCKHCAPGQPCATYRGTFDPVPGSDAETFIQWKGTDVCIDFYCPCDADVGGGHFDGFFGYFLRCPNCGAVYEMGTQVKARRLGDDEAWLISDNFVKDLEP